ncbi:GNAT family protein [Helicobacter pylori]
MKESACGQADEAGVVARVTTPEIQWPRAARALQLRPPTPSDIDQVLRWRTRSDVSRWLIRTRFDPKEYRAAMLRSVDDPRDHHVVALHGNTVVGTVQLEITDGLGQDEDPDPWRGCEGQLGYFVDPAHAGHGYATAMAGAMLALAFDQLGLRRVTAGCFADNIASWRAMERVGMRREQHGVRDSWHAQLGWIDGYTYGILAEEWQAQPERR